MFSCSDDEHEDRIELPAGSCVNCQGHYNNKKPMYEYPCVYIIFINIIYTYIIVGYVLYIVIISVDRLKIIRFT